MRKACDTTGTATASGYTESRYNLAVARETARILRATARRSILTRPRRPRRRPVHHPPRADRQPRGGRRRGLDPRRRRPSAAAASTSSARPRIDGLTDDIYVASRRLGRLDARRLRGADRAPARDVPRRQRARRARRSRRPAARPTCRRCSSRRPTCATRPTPASSSHAASASGSRAASPRACSASWRPDAFRIVLPPRSFDCAAGGRAGRFAPESNWRDPECMDVPGPPSAAH